MDNLETITHVIADHSIGIALYIVFVILVIVSGIFAGIALHNFKTNIDKSIKSNISTKLKQATTALYGLKIALVVVSILFVGYQLNHKHYNNEMVFVMLFLLFSVNASLYFIFKNITINEFGKTYTLDTAMARPSGIADILAIIVAASATYFFKHT